MLRDLGQMVAEAEKLGSVAAVTAPPSPLPQPAPPPPPAPSPAVGRSPFDILGAAPAPPRPPEPRGRTRHERGRPAASRHRVRRPVRRGAREAGRGGEEASDDWQLDEPTRSKKAPPPPPPLRAPSSDAGRRRRRLAARSPRWSEPSRRAPPGRSPSRRFDGSLRPPGFRRPSRGSHGDHPVGGLAGFAPAPGGGTDRPTEILGRSHLPLPCRRSRAAAAPPAPYFDRPTEILPHRASGASPRHRWPLRLLPLRHFVDRPTEILQAIAPPLEKAERSEKPRGPEAGASPRHRRPPSPPPRRDRPADRDPQQPVPAPGARPCRPRPSLGDAGEEGATERIVDAMKLGARRSAGAEASRARPSAPADTRLPAGRSLLRRSRSAKPPRSRHPVPRRLLARCRRSSSRRFRNRLRASPPAGPLLKRSVNGKFVALIIGVVLVGAGVVAGTPLVEEGEDRRAGRRRRGSASARCRSSRP